MPRVVDREERQLRIAEATLRLLGDNGPGGLTLRRLAEELGGSITLITHFYRNRDELLEGVLTTVLAGYEAELERLERGADAHGRLRILLEWLLPLDEPSRLQEKGRIVMLGHLGPDPAVRRFVDAMEERMTGLLRRHLEPLTPAPDLAGAVDALRVVTNGVILSAVEHPGEWPVGRQLKVLDSALGALGLARVAVRG
ncbi:TetR/AcrR family transcriptional regulator [Streptomyces sp. NBC_00459]|uniref:TetR/AcrR family transcriptional regulator n=1 Tax=Streptomyces sp. NBC_00459 TaxID=2975749 RepID=UPI002E17C462